MEHEYVRYDPATGRIISHGSCPEGMKDLQGPFTVQGRWPADKFYIDLLTRRPRSIPPSPSPHHSFDFGVRNWRDMRPLDQIKDAVWEVAKQQREKDTAAPFTHEGMVFDAGPESLASLTAHATAAEPGKPYSVVWTLANNSRVTLNAGQVRAVQAGITARNAAIHEQSQVTRTNVYAAASREALDTLLQGTPMYNVLVDNRPSIPQRMDFK